MWKPGLWELDEIVQGKIQAMHTHGDSDAACAVCDDHDDNMYFIDGCAGHSSMGLWAVRRYPNSKVMVIDKAEDTLERLQAAGFTELELT